MQKNVKSGDTDGREAVAAAEYFKILLKENGTRRNSDFTALFDYGYAILRSNIAKSLIGAGFSPALAVKHHNTHNPFNLVEDLIEAYRPIVDYTIFAKNLRPELTQETKKVLVQILEQEILIKGKRYPVQNAIEETIHSLKQAMRQQNPALLTLPTITQYTLHDYEMK